MSFIPIEGAREGRKKEPHGRLVIEHCVKMIYFLKVLLHLHSLMECFISLPLSSLSFSPQDVAMNIKKAYSIFHLPLPFLGPFLFDHETLIRDIQSAANLLNVTKMFLQKALLFLSLFFLSLSLSCLFGILFFAYLLFKCDTRMLKTREKLKKEEKK
jgi:hypothetical protein